MGSAIGWLYSHTRWPVRSGHRPCWLQLADGDVATWILDSAAGCRFPPRRVLTSGTIFETESPHNSIWIDHGSSKLRIHCFANDRNQRLYLSILSATFIDYTTQSDDTTYPCVDDPVPAESDIRSRNSEGRAAVILRNCQGYWCPGSMRFEQSLDLWAFKLACGRGRWAVRFCCLWICDLWRTARKRFHEAFVFACVVLRASYWLGQC